jgi:Tfp pilus assembly protein PilP
MLAPEPRAAIVEMPAPPRPVEPPLKLSGIAEDPGPDGPVRMAFISGEGQLYMVKVGDPVTARYKVERISSDVVELLDLTENTTRRLAMRQ